MRSFIHHVLTVFVIVTALFVSPVSMSAAPTDASISPMLQKVMPAVVNIRAQIKITDFNTLQELLKQRRNQPPGSDETIPNTFMSVGSGVIVDANKGLIVTNAHVVNDAQTVTVTLSDGRHFTAKIIGADKPSDVALLQIKAKNLTSVPFGDSNKLKVGDFVAAIGNPFGLSQTATSGIVSALGRTMLGIESYENFIQTDAPINPGNSGGALMNANGELIGINTAILAPNQGSIGIGFAIPANMVKSVILQLIEYGNVKRGVLGIGAQDITPELANAFHTADAKGAAVTQVLQDSPAQQAGLQVGDIITAINGSAVKNASDVVNTIGFLRVDSRANISILRQGKKIDLTVSLSDPKKRKEIIEQSNPFLYGVGLRNFSLLSPIHGYVDGVQVLSVEDSSNAWNADLRVGDVITSVNQQKIKNLDDLKVAIAKSHDSLLLNVLRGPGAVFVVISKEGG